MVTMDAAQIGAFVGSVIGGTVIAILTARELIKKAIKPVADQVVPSQNPNANERHANGDLKTIREMLVQVLENDRKTQQRLFKLEGEVRMLIQGKIPLGGAT